MSQGRPSPKITFHQADSAKQMSRLERWPSAPFSGQHLRRVWGYTAASLKWCFDGFNSRSAHIVPIKGGIARHTSKNYKEDNGNTLVIGGKLKFLPGAEVENFPEPSNDEIFSIENQPESTATTVAGVRQDLNELLAKLKASGLMEADDDIQ